MTIITENTIDSFIGRYESEDSFITDFKEMAAEQPDLMSFINQENYSLLTPEELSLLEYLTLIIYFSSKSTLSGNPVISGNELERFEEENWNVFNGANTKNFNKILDIFFAGYVQEDLLALIEDSIELEEDNIVTSVGREIIFVACKSIIDTLDHLN